MIKFKILKTKAIHDVFGKPTILFFFNHLEGNTAEHLFMYPRNYQNKKASNFVRNCFIAFSKIMITPRINIQLILNVEKIQSGIFKVYYYISIIEL